MLVAVASVSVAESGAYEMGRDVEASVVYAAGIVVLPAAEEVLVSVDCAFVTALAELPVEEMVLVSDVEVLVSEDSVAVVSIVSGRDVDILVPDPLLVLETLMLLEELSVPVVIGTTTEVEPEDIDVLTRLEESVLVVNPVPVPLDAVDDVVEEVDRNPETGEVYPEGDDVVIGPVPVEADVEAELVIGTTITWVPEVESEVDAAELSVGELAGALLVAAASLESCEEMDAEALATIPEAEDCNCEAMDESVDAMLEISEVRDDSIAESTLETAEETTSEVGKVKLKLAVGVVKVRAPVPVGIPADVLDDNGTTTSDVSLELAEAPVPEDTEEAGPEVVLLSLDTVVEASDPVAVVVAEGPVDNGRVRDTGLVSGSPVVPVSIEMTPVPVGRIKDPLSVGVETILSVPMRDETTDERAVSDGRDVAPVRPDRMVDSPITMLPVELVSVESVAVAMTEAPVAEGWIIVIGRPPVEPAAVPEVVTAAEVESLAEDTSLVALGALERIELKSLESAEMIGSTIGMLADPVPAVESMEVRDGRSVESAVGETVSETAPPVEPTDGVVVALAVGVTVSETEPPVDAMLPLDVSSSVDVAVDSSDVAVDAAVVAAVGLTDSVAGPPVEAMLPLDLSSAVIVEDNSSVVAVDAVVVVVAAVGLTDSVVGPPVEAIEVCTLLKIGTRFVNANDVLEEVVSAVVVGAVGLTDSLVTTEPVDATKVADVSVVVLVVVSSSVVVELGVELVVVLELRRVGVTVSVEG